MEERKAAMYRYSLGVLGAEGGAVPPPPPSPQAEDPLHHIPPDGVQLLDRARVVNTGPSSVHFCHTVGAFLAQSALVVLVVVWGEVEYPPTLCFPPKYAGAG